MITADTKELEKLEKGLTQFNSILPKGVAAVELRKISRPVLQKVKALVPVGKTKSNDGWGKTRGPAYRRGGATRADARIKVVNPNQGEIARVAVGISKAKGKVGWRTGFLTRGTKDRKRRNGQSTGSIRANNFLQKALDTTVIVVRSDFRELTLRAFERWAKKNLPQGRI